jgi:hypothetical protein
MSFIHNAGTVAKYEAKTLRRSWFFRLFSLGSLAILTLINIGIFSPVGDQGWDMISIPSTLPLINLYLLNIGQAVVVIFLAADFLKRDKKLDTNEVLYTRSMSNFEYVLGKTWGIIRLFLGLNLIILTIGLTVNIIQKKMTIDILSYIEYLLIIPVPTIVFSLGLAFMLMSLIRNQAVTFLLLLGIAALDMFWLWYRAGSIFDYMAFGLPVFKSQITGFDNPEIMISQRLFFFFLGMALVMGTILMFRRLPQSRLHTSLAITFMFISLLASALCGYNTYSAFRNKSDTKKAVIKTNRLFENRKFPVVTDAGIDLIHKGDSIEAMVKLKISNENSEYLNCYIFSLNPSLTVSKITSDGKELNYITTNHIIEIEPASGLEPGGYDSVTISYSGAINEAFCSPGYSDNLNYNINRIAMVNVSKRQSFMSDDYLLLTPETHWYPVASLNYYPSNPARIKIDFTRYTLRVKTRDGLVTVSQGRMKSDSIYRTFLPESPLTGLTVAIGNYRSDTLKVDSVTFVSHYFTGNDYYKKDLSELKDTLSFLVSGIMRDLETSFSTKYPFSTLTLLEVPVQFYSYPKKSTQTRSEVQPGMILLPERMAVLDYAGFSERFEEQKKRMARNNQVITDKELQVRLFNDFVRNTFITGNNYVSTRNDTYAEPSRYRLGPSFFFFRNNFNSSEYPLINAVFESHLQQLIQQEPRPGFMSMLGILSENDRANLILRDNSFRDLLAQNPQGDTVRIVLAVKGDWFFNLIRCKAGIEEFNEWFRQYCYDNSFKSINILQFRNDILKKFNFDFYPYLDNWFNGKEQPGFLFKGLITNEIIVDERSRYQVSFVASNPENVPGIFNISFRSEGQGGPGRQGQPMSGAFQPGGGGQGGGSAQGRGMETSDIEKIILLEPGETKKIALVTDAQPRAVLINTLFARNIPGTINIPVNEIIKTKNKIDQVSGEEKLTSAFFVTDSSEIIVDNEDRGFVAGKQVSESPLKKIFGITNRRSNTYMQISQWNIPEYWQPVVLNSYYGKYVRSAVYTRAGTGDRSISWYTVINDPGYYDIYCYAGKTADRLTVRRSGGAGAGGPEEQQGQGREQEEGRFKDFHFKIYHDEGVEEITFDYDKADAEWNNLGRYYLSGDTAKVILSNQSSGRLVIGDAIKWVKVK